MLPRFDYGHQVRVIRTIRDDGTYPGKARGALLVKRGSIGYVRDVSTFLQDQLIYRVHFIDQDMQVGCRDNELIDSNATWRPSRFEFRQMVIATKELALDGQIIVKSGDAGQVLKVASKDGPSSNYHVHFHGRTLLVGEQSLEEQSHA